MTSETDQAAYEARVLGDLCEATLPIVMDAAFPNFACWPVELPAGHWRTIHTLLRQRLLGPDHRLSDEQREGVRQHVWGLTSDQETYDAPRGGWVCFHCGARLRTEAAGRLHFGADPATPAICRQMQDRTSLPARLVAYANMHPESVTACELLTEAATRISRLVEENKTAGQYTAAHEALDDLARERVAAADDRALAAEAERDRLRGALEEGRDWLEDANHARGCGVYRENNTRYDPCDCGLNNVRRLARLALADRLGRGSASQKPDHLEPRQAPTDQGGAG